MRIRAHRAPATCGLLLKTASPRNPANQRNIQQAQMRCFASAPFTAGCAATWMSPERMGMTAPAVLDNPAAAGHIVSRHDSASYYLRRLKCPARLAKMVQLPPNTTKPQVPSMHRLISSSNSSSSRPCRKASCCV